MLEFHSEDIKHTKLTLLYKRILPLNACPDRLPDNLISRKKVGQKDNSKNLIDAKLTS